jgi:hypothetical protein
VFQQHSGCEKAKYTPTARIGVFKVTPKTFLHEFQMITEELKNTVERKNNDYTGGGEAFANFELGEKIGIGPTDQGILWRMTDKLARVIALTKVDAQVKDESVADTLKDLAAYAIILLIWYRYSSSLQSGNFDPDDFEKFANDCRKIPVSRM